MLPGQVKVRGPEKGFKFVCVCVCACVCVCVKMKAKLVTSISARASAGGMTYGEKKRGFIDESAKQSRRSACTNSNKIEPGGQRAHVIKKPRNTLTSIYGPLKTFASCSADALILCYSFERLHFGSGTNIPVQKCALSKLIFLSTDDQPSCSCDSPEAFNREKPVSV